MVMSVNEASTASLIGRLGEGWGPSHCGLARELLARWGTRLATQVQIRNVSDNALHFESDLTNLRLRAMDRVPCLLLGGQGGSAGSAEKLWRQVEEPGRLLFVLALSDAAYERVLDEFSPGRCLVLAPDRVGAILEAPEPRQLLCELLWQQIPRRRLIPYNILRPADGTTFFGRRRELERLRDEDDTSFAIAGPGRIGKTSLVQQYHREMRLSKSRAHRIHYINFYECADKTSDGIARFLATRIESSSQSARVTATGLVNALRYNRNQHGGPLDLLLDEVDEVCQSETFHFLGEAARQQLCRLVLCGRGALMRATQDKRSPLAGRLELLRLEPLDHASARRLLVEPLTALGFVVSEPDRFVEDVLHLTGCLPHVLQFFGKKLAALGIEQNSTTITQDHIATLKCDFDTAQYFTQVLRELSDSTTRLVALLLLRISSGPVSIPRLVDAAAREGFHLSQARAVDACNDLVIHNVLTWIKDSYYIANGALVYFARRLGFLSKGLEEALAEARHGLPALEVRT
jgi:hypothetical protein